MPKKEFQLAYKISIFYSARIIIKSDALNPYNIYYTVCILVIAHGDDYSRRIKGRIKVEESTEKKEDILNCIELAIF